MAPRDALARMSGGPLDRDVVRARLDDKPQRATFPHLDGPRLTVAARYRP